MKLNNARFYPLNFQKANSNIDVCYKAYVERIWSNILYKITEKKALSLINKVIKFTSFFIEYPTKLIKIFYSRLDMILK